MYADAGDIHMCRLSRIKHSSSSMVDSQLSQPVVTSTRSIMTSLVTLAMTGMLPVDSPMATVVAR